MKLKRDYLRKLNKKHPVRTRGHNTQKRYNTILNGTYDSA